MTQTVKALGDLLSSQGRRRNPHTHTHARNQCYSFVLRKTGLPPDEYEHVNVRFSPDRRVMVSHAGSQPSMQLAPDLRRHPGRAMYSPA